MIFISAPYSHPDKTVEHSRFVEMCKYNAHLMARKFHAVCPVVIGHQLLAYAKLPGDFTFWKDYSFDLLDGCSILHVLKLEGWDTSVGVKAEIQYAHFNNIIVIDVDISDFGNLRKYVETLRKDSEQD